MNPNATFRDLMKMAEEEKSITLYYNRRLDSHAPLATSVVNLLRCGAKSIVIYLGIINKKNYESIKNSLSDSLSLMSTNHEYFNFYDSLHNDEELHSVIVTRVVK